MTLDDIKKLGARKYFEDGGIYKNPHPMGTPEFNEFERGWMQSLKRDEGRHVNIGGNRAERQSTPARTAPDPSELSAERYRSRKG
jgi:hypothetical protein